MPKIEARDPAGSEAIRYKQGPDNPYLDPTQVVELYNAVMYANSIGYPLNISAVWKPRLGGLDDYKEILPAFDVFQSELSLWYGSFDLDAPYLYVWENDSEDGLVCMLMLNVPDDLLLCFRRWLSTIFMSDSGLMRPGFDRPAIGDCISQMSHPDDQLSCMATMCGSINPHQGFRHHSTGFVSYAEMLSIQPRKTGPVAFPRMGVSSCISMRRQLQEGMSPFTLPNCLASVKQWLDENRGRAGCDQQSLAATL